LNTVSLKLFGKTVRIDFDNRYVAPLLRTCYSAFRIERLDEPAALTLTVHKDDGNGLWTVDCDGSAVSCDNVADLVYFIEKGMTVALQTQRPDLYFVHAAAVGLADGCTLIVGESGAGKSTLCWNLCNDGFTYLSDELAPVDPQTLTVEPYPHALCLKSRSHAAFSFPVSTLDTAATLHVPVEALPLPVATRPSPIRNIVFLTHGDGKAAPVFEDISRSEAAARLYANSLNQLAHDKDGLAAAARVASEANCFHMERGTAESMCQAVKTLATRPAAREVQ
jgi:hypothetical protein